LFLQGKPLNVTDVARGPDGAMYLITGGRKTQSSLYRISAKSDIGSRDVPTAIDAGQHAMAVAEFARQQRSKRQQLEEVSRQRDRSRLEFVADALGDADPVVRQAARIALERLPKELWRNLALQPDTGATGNQRLFAQLAFAQAMQPSDVPTLLTYWLQYDPHRFDLAQTIVWVRQCELMLGVDSPAVQARQGEVSRRLQSVWPMTTARHVAPEGTAADLRIRLAQLLGQLHAESAMTVIARDLLTSPIQEERIAGLLAVRHQRTGWTTAMRRLQLEALRDTSSMIGGQGLPTFLEGIKADTLATPTGAEKEDLKLLLQPAQPAEQLEAVPVRPLVQKWQMKDLASLAESTGLAQPATVDSKADRQRGEKIYREAQCIRCHRAGSIGRAVGPDLTYVGRRFSSRDLLESIVLPSRSVAENYRLDAVVTVDGTVHTGQIVVSGDYRSEKLLIQTDALRADSVVEIDKRDVEEHRQLERSPMPEGLLDHFSPAEIRDLLAYLQNP
ncbi:MAG: c-type cytochrome, partial [Pirellulaceae bacterium]|nr:c-type cytochrome [Pirellulaceae bacterium]